MAENFKVFGVAEGFLFIDIKIRNFKVKDWLIPALTRCNNNEHHRGSGIFPRKGGFCLDTHSMREHNL